MNYSAAPRVDLIWNKGIASRCEWRFPDEFPDGLGYSHNPVYAGAFYSPRLPDNLISDLSSAAGIRTGDLVWVRLSWLNSFARHILPLVKVPFILVTGDSDSCAPSELGSVARTILNCSSVVCWFTQNYDGTMPAERIQPIPIGIDFHTLAERPYWGEEMTSPAGQQQALLSTAASLLPLRARRPKVYADFGWQGGLGIFSYRRFHRLHGTSFRADRRAVAKKLRGNECVYWQSGPMPRSQMWRRRGEYAFVLSPHGVGLDCLRCWEALALGHIVLTPSSSLDPLYDGLPVVPLKSWSEITPDNLETWLSMYPCGAGDHPKLRTDFWIEVMRSAMGTLPPSPDNLRLSLSNGRRESFRTEIAEFEH